MPVINFLNPYAVILAVVFFLLVLFLGRNTKKAWVMGALLILSLGLLVAHTVELNVFVQSEYSYEALTISLMFDLAFILVSFLSYLWIDHIEAQQGKSKVIADGLDWFWKKV